MSGPERVNPTTFGRNLKAALVLADMTAAQLAAEVGEELEIGVGTIERVMQGRRPPRPWEVSVLARAIGVSTDFLLHGPSGGAAREPESARELELLLEAFERHDREHARQFEAIAEQLRELMRRTEPSRERAG